MRRIYTERKNVLALALLAVVVLIGSCCCAHCLANVRNSASKSGRAIAAKPGLALDDPDEAAAVKSRLPEIARAALKRHFAGDGTQSLSQFADSFAVPPCYQKQSGLFVTFSRDGKTRACWGALSGRYKDLVKATVYTTEEALTNEYRFKKVTADEVDSLKAQVTVVRQVEALSNLSQQNPRMCGMLVRSGSKSGVILPGEASDPYYQLMMCKVKAGIQRNEPCQIYRIKADVYR